MAEDHNQDAEELQSADAKRAGPGLRFLAWFLLLLAIIAVIATPILRYQREQQIKANEAVAINHIRTITEAQFGTSWRGENNYAASFVVLTDSIHGPRFLLGDWYNGVEKDGYIFTMKGLGKIYDTPLPGPGADCYEVTASPARPGHTGIRYFFSDCNGVIYGKVGGPADSTSTPVAAYPEWLLDK